jgi:hypothetical protein
VLLAFINPSGPTREPQEVYSSGKRCVPISAAEHPLDNTQPVGSCLRYSQPGTNEFQA